jgi:hypothetical protein
MRLQQIKKLPQEFSFASGKPEFISLILSAKIGALG